MTILLSCSLCQGYDFGPVKKQLRNPSIGLCAGAILGSSITWLIANHKLYNYQMRQAIEDGLENGQIHWNLAYKIAHRINSILLASWTERRGNIEYHYRSYRPLGAREQNNYYYFADDDDYLNMQHHEQDLRRYAETLPDELTPRYRAFNKIGRALSFALMSYGTWGLLKKIKYPPDYSL